jgi:hypothetical protein
MSYDLSLILNLDQQTPAARRVLSATARSLLDLPPLISGDTYACELKGITSAGAVATGSGTALWLPRLRITYVNSAGTVVLLAAVEPAAFTIVTGGWTFLLPLTTAELLAALPDGADPLTVNFDLTVTDPTGYIHTWYRRAASIHSRLYNPTGILPTPTVTLQQLTDAVAAAEDAQAAAESARDLALQYRDAALASAGDAQAAQSAANLSAVSAASARDAAIVARDAAQLAHTAAEAAQAAATTQAGNSLASANAASASQAAALASQNAAAASAAAALASENAAVASAAAALISQNAAAASAVTAAAAVAAQFLGGVAGNAVPATATAAGYYYRVTSAGTSQGKTWAVGDMAIYNGTSGSWTQLAGILPYATEAEARAGTDTTKALNSATGNARALLGDISRIVGDSLFLDGSTTSARGYAALGTPGDGLGAGKLSKWDIVSVPASNPAIVYGIWVLGPGAGNYDSPSANFSLGCFITTGGVLRVTISSGDPNYYSRTCSLTANFVSTYGGQGALLHVTWDGVTIPLIYINGVLQATSEATGGASPPAWTQVVSDDYQLVGRYGLNDYFRGRITPGPFINSILSAADIFVHAQTGRLPPWCDLGTGSMVPIISPSVLNGGFETAGAGGADVFANWTEAISGASSIADETTIVRSGAHSCKMTVGADTGYVGIAQAGLTVGRRYRLELWARDDGSGGRLVVKDDLGTTSYAVLDVLTTSWVKSTVEFTAVRSTFYIERYSPAGASKIIYLDDVTLIPIGLISKWVFQPGCPIATDSGANKTPFVLTPGASALGDKPAIIEIPIPAMTADGFIHLDQVISPAGYELFSAVIERTAGSGTGTVTIKETSSGGTTVATGALGATPTALTISNVFSAANKKLHLANSSWSSSTLIGRLLFRRYA